MIRAVVLVGVAGVMLAELSAPALADDRSLREAGRSRDAQFERLGNETKRAYAKWNRSGHRRREARRLIRLLRSARSEVDIVVAAVNREQPSSADGETYKRKLLAALDLFDRGLMWEIRGVRARTAGHVGRARRAFRRAFRLHERALRLEREAVEAIERVVPSRRPQGSR